MNFFLSHLDISINIVNMCPCVRMCVHPDDNKALWGINIMKKAKKTGSPKAFGVRLEDCQPAVNHKVSLDSEYKDNKNSTSADSSHL